MFDDADGALSIVVTNEHGDRVECVEEKVRVELRLECGEARTRELFREPGDLHFTFTRVDEVSRRVLDADDAEVDGHAKRQRGEDPTEPFNSKLKPELCRTFLHCCVIKVWRKDPDQDQSQHLPAGGPRDAEQY